MNVTVVSHTKGEVPTRIRIGSNLHGLRICALEIESLDELKMLMHDDQAREWLARHVKTAWVPPIYKKGNRDGIRIL